MCQLGELILLNCTGTCKASKDREKISMVAERLHDPLLWFGATGVSGEQNPHSRSRSSDKTCAHTVKGGSCEGVFRGSGWKTGSGFFDESRPSQP